MRASQSPGASSSERVGTICGPSHRRLRPSSPAAFDDAAAERGTLFVVAALELEAEQPVDERGGVAALEPVPAQRFVDAFVRAHHAFADRLDDDVGVALEHTDEALELLEHRPLSVRAHRAEQRAGVTEAAQRLHGLGIGEVEAAELLFERLGVHLVRADVVLGELPEVFAHPRDRTLGAVHRLAQDRARTGARRRAATTPRRSRRRCAARTPTWAWPRAGAGGRTDPAPGARADRSSSRTTRRAAPATSSA